MRKTTTYLILLLALGSIAIVAVSRSPDSTGDTGKTPSAVKVHSIAQGADAEIEREHSPELSPSTTDTVVPPSFNGSGFLVPVDASVLDAGVLDDFTRDKPIARLRLVQLNADALLAEIRDETSQSFEIELFEDVSLALSLYQKGVDPIGFAKWMGKVADDESSTALLIVQPDGKVEGDIITSNGVFKIETSGVLPYHVVWQMDRDYKINYD